MLLTRKHFELVADAIKTSRTKKDAIEKIDELETTKLQRKDIETIINHSIEKNDVVEELCKYFWNNNHRFDDARFKEACI